MKKYINTIIRYTRNQAKGISCYIALRAAKSVIVIVNPLIYAGLITNLLENTLQKTIYSFLILCICYITNLLLGHLLKIVENRLSKQINYEMKKQITEKLFSIPPSQLNIEQGRMFSLVLSDTSVISSMLFVLISSLFSVFTILGIGIVVFIIDWKLALILLCTYPINILVNAHFNKLLKDRAVKFLEQNDNYVSLLKDTIGRINDVSILGGRKKINEELDNKNYKVYEASLSQGVVKNNYSSSVSAISLINHLLMTVVGIIFVYSSYIGFGDFVAFNTYSKNFSSSIDSIINLNTVLQPGMVSIDRLLFLEDQYNCSKQLETNKVSINFPIKSIHFDKVSFFTKKRNIVNEISFKIKAGEVVGISGENASGKTTIANLLLTNIIPTSGMIYINHQPITSFTYDSIVQHITYVGTSKSLFQVSILHNLLLSYNGNSPDYNKINNICTLLNVSDDINNLPNQLDTIASDKAKLSSGQIQKIQLARALLCNSDILILDEAFSNLDVTTKAQLKEHLMKLKCQGKMIIIISHMPDDYSICDKKFVIKNGELHSI